MKNFKSGSRFGSRGGGRKHAVRNSRPGMHDAVCSNCGKDCQVPFKPTGDRPIFCSKCFDQNEGGSFERRDSRGDSRRSFYDKPLFTVNCDSCGKRCEVPFKPTGSKPVYCDDCFGSGGSSSSKKSSNSGISKNQLDELNAKLDRILEVLGA